MRGSHLGAPTAARRRLAAAVVGAAVALPVILPGVAQAAARRPATPAPAAVVKRVATPTPPANRGPGRVIYGHKLA
jgi:hypothetical protein